VLQVSSKVQDQSAGDVGDSRNSAPEIALVPISFDFTPEGPEVAVENGRNGGSDQGSIRHQCAVPPPAR
jgi:hypothetical protein